MQIFIKYFYFSCISCFGKFILVFPFHGNVVLLSRENVVCLLFIISFHKSENTKNTPPIPTFHD